MLGNMTDRSTTPVARARAIKDIADALADRTSFVLVVAQHLNETVGSALDGIDANVYIDGGIDSVLRTDQPRALIPMSALAKQCAAVILVPKTVSAGELSAALGTPVADDGSQDVVYLIEGYDESGYANVPQLFLEALKRLGPDDVARVRPAGT
jgi:hypothetical protein